MGTTKLSDVMSLSMQKTMSTITEKKEQKAKDSFFSALDNATKANLAADTGNNRMDLAKTNTSIDESRSDINYNRNDKVNSSDRTDSTSKDMRRDKLSDKASDRDATGEKVSGDRTVEENLNADKQTDDASNILDLLNVIADQLGITTDELVANVDELQQQITDILIDKLGITNEQLGSALEALGLTTLDLLEPNNLMNLMVELQPGADASTILTDEQMYSEFKEIVEELGQIDTGLTDEQLKAVNEALEKSMAIPKDAVDESEGPLVKTADAGTNSAEAASEVEETVVVKNTNHTESEFNQNADNGANNQQNLNNLAMQLNNVAEQAVNLSEQAAEAFSSRMDAQNIVNQLIEQVKVQVNADTTSMEMQLYPESYGKLNLSVAVREGVVTAQIAVENEAVRAALESQIVQLRENMNEQGLKVEAIEVTVQTHEFERNLDQNEDNGEQESAQQSSGVRRNINLDDLDDDDEVDQLTEAEELTRRIMIQNGNRVNFSA